jgi:hypothetical protein
MPGLRRDVIWQIAERECFRFHFQVDVRVNVRGVQGDIRMVLMSTAERSKWDVGHRKGKTYV